MLILSSAERRSLRARAHALHPVASVSDKGLTTAVLAEIDRALNSHQLIKVRVYGEDRAAREGILGELCTALSCAAVQHIGHILVVFRPAQEAPVAPSEKPETKPGRRTPRSGPKPTRPAANRRRRSA